jgi:hypothetical protein
MNDYYYTKHTSTKDGEIQHLLIVVSIVTSA